MNKDDNAIMKSIPFGIEDFKELRENDGYFVDKTVLIEDILKEKNTKAFLFTRPRRFGKSLNMSMLDAFFNLDYAGKGQKWFEGLRIYDNKELMALANQDPVVYFTLKGVRCDDYDNFLTDFRKLMKKVTSDYEYLLGWETESNIKSDFMELYNGEADESGLIMSLKTISDALCRYHGRKAIILMDEYDNPINGSFGMESQKKILTFMRYLMTNALKSNESLKFGVVTGVMQIAKESIFSGLNNLYVNNVFDKDFDECYGFTESEVKEILSYYGHPEKFDECKEWYDGYRFGNLEVYNPWSVINYVRKRFEPAAYWGGTSGNDIIETLIRNADDDTWKKLTDLGNGKTINSMIRTTVTMNDIKGSGADIYSVLVMSGYLNAVPDGDEEYSLSIPNNEMRRVYAEMMSKELNDGADVQFRKVFNAMREADVQKVEKTLFDLLDNKIPFFAISEESDYQKILAVSAMCTQGKYVTTMESESGNGRVDVKMTSKDVRCPHIVMELKKTKSDSPDIWQSEAEGALQQIKDRKYHNGLTGRILLYGICFHGKEAKVVMEEVSC